MYEAFTLFGGLSQNPSTNKSGYLLSSITPKDESFGLGSFPFARRYSGNRCFFLFLRLLRCFSSPGSLHAAMDSRHGRWSSSSGVSPFRNLRVNGYVLLTAAYRSLSRLSSAPSAKASALCPSLLDLFESVPSSFEDLLIHVGRYSVTSHACFFQDSHFNSYRID